MSTEQDDEGVFVVVAEFRHQAPIVMEAEGEHSGRDAAFERASRVPGALRTCVARLTYEGGNALLLHDIKRLQK